MSTGAGAGNGCHSDSCWVALQTVAAYFSTQLHFIEALTLVPIVFMTETKEKAR